MPINEPMSSPVASTKANQSEKSIAGRKTTAYRMHIGVVTPDYQMAGYAADAAWMIHRAAHQDPNERLVKLLRDICGSPFRRWPEWRSIRSFKGIVRFDTNALPGSPNQFSRSLRGFTPTEPSTASHCCLLPLKKRAASTRRSSTTAASRESMCGVAGSWT